MLDSSHLNAHRSASGGTEGPRQRIGGVDAGGRHIEGRPNDQDPLPGRCLRRNRHRRADTGQHCRHRHGHSLLETIAPAKRLLADKAYDADRLQHWLADRRIEAVIPGRATRNAAYLLNRSAYRHRNVIERMFGKLKNRKRIAARYDRLAVNFLAAIALAALATQWLK